MMLQTYSKKKQNWEILKKFTHQKLVANPQNSKTREY